MVFLIVGGILLPGGILVSALRRSIAMRLGDALPLGFPDGWVSPTKVGIGGAGLVVAGAFSAATGILLASTT